MILDAVLVVSGLALLVLGGEALVRGACGLALLARVTPAVVGLTVVAAGTSMPELVVSVQAAIEGSPGIAAGNIVGSNVFNIAAILGVTALILPLRIRGSTVRLEWPVMALASFQFLLLARDGLVDRLEGGFLTAALVAFTGYAVWVARGDAATLEQGDGTTLTTASFGRTGGTAWGLNGAAVACGVGLLAAGSTLLVEGSVGIAGALGVSETVIGLTIVAAGTSTPELVTSIVAARRGQDAIAIANVVGSNIFNLLGIGGAVALIHPLPVPREIVDRDIWWMFGTALLLFPLMKSGMRITRREGAVLLAAYLAYLGFLLAAQ